jgi:hypothetical protein
MPIAERIIEQMGNGKFLAMTGAKNFVAGAHQVHFNIGRNPKKISKVSITLDGNDTYRMQFLHIYGTSVTLLADVANVQVAQLREVFERETGLRVSL